MEEEKSPQKVTCTHEGKTNEKKKKKKKWKHGKWGWQKAAE
jgi:hypothetical protein